MFQEAIVPNSNGTHKPEGPGLNLTLEYNEGNSCLSLHILSIANIHLLPAVKINTILHVSLVDEKLEKIKKHSLDLIVKTHQELLNVDRKLKFVVTFNNIADSRIKVSRFMNMLYLSFQKSYF